MNRVGSFTAFADSSRGLVTAAHSMVRVYTQLPLLVQVDTMLSWKNGGLGRRPALALTGAIHLLELKAEIVFRKRRDDELDSPDAHRARAVIVPLGFEMPLVIQHFGRPAPEENDAWVLTRDLTGERPWVEHYAGRIEKHPLTFDLHVPALATLDAWFTPQESQGGRETKVELMGELRFDQNTNIRLLFRNPALPTTPPPQQGGEAAVIAAGTRIPVNRQAVSGAIGPNPWISMRVLEEGGRVVCNERPLGRSVRIPA